MKSQQSVSTAIALAMLATAMAVPLPQETDDISYHPATTVQTVIGTSTLSVVGYVDENNRFVVDNADSKAAISSAHAAVEAQATTDAIAGIAGAIGDGATAAAQATTDAIAGTAGAIGDGATAAAQAASSLAAVAGIASAVRTAPVPSASAPCSSITWPAGEAPDAISAMCDPRM